MKFPDRWALARLLVRTWFWRHKVTMARVPDLLAAGWHGHWCHRCESVIKTCWDDERQMIHVIAECPRWRALHWLAVRSRSHNLPSAWIRE